MQPGHHKTGDEPADAGNDQGRHNGDDEGPVLVISEVAHHHGGKSQHGADGEIDAADQNHDGHAHRHHPENRDLIHHVQEVA